MKGWVLELKDDELVVCEGTLMHHDTPVAEIYVDERDVMEIHMLTDDKVLYPFEMQYIDGVAGFRAWLEERVTPKSRQGIMDELNELGYRRYSIATILITSNGRDCSDPFWIRFKTGPQTWKEVWAAVGVYNRV